ncbi:PEP-CTERM sorting domain-containing protein [uncultured Psychromonas sp.]|uniref:PEP-CTERM sorting domain-containing protein n=1 Tax=uncultured Psychromonas sp. TaxID=173974 RepID=UPI002610683D|nr:PEP-CTERM sorting domain-containing protein [uncultured Psychromonas sp.]
MKKILCLFVCFFVGTVNATVIDFTGDYDVTNWNQSLDGGNIDLSGAPSSILAISSNVGSGSSSTDFTIASTTNGWVSFDWIYSTSDLDGSTYDPFGWLLNGVFTQLSTDGLFGTQSGSELFSVNAGEIFGFSARTPDSALGSATTSISSFAVPAPSTLVVLALGLFGLAFGRRKNNS